MAINTGTGDGGESGLIGGQRVLKDDPRLEAYGTVDELNAAIGWLRTVAPASLDAELQTISEWLFALGSDLATPEAARRAIILPAEATLRLDAWIARDEAYLPPLRRFILPGGCPAAAACHLARTICRRAERHVVTLHRVCGEGRAAIVFLNRLSDLLFLYARRANHEAQVQDVEWRP